MGAGEAPNNNEFDEDFSENEQNEEEIDEGNKLVEILIFSDFYVHFMSVFIQFYLLFLSFLVLFLVFYDFLFVHVSYFQL